MGANASLNATSGPSMYEKYAVNDFAIRNEAAALEKVPVPVPQLIRESMAKERLSQQRKSSFDQYFELHSLQMFT